MATPTRLGRYVSRVEQDQRTHDLLILIHSHRGRGVTWADIVGVLVDAIDGWDYYGPLDAAFREYAGPYRLWETVLHVIAVAWGQEREREREETEMQQ